MKTNNWKDLQLISLADDGKIMVNYSLSDVTLKKSGKMLFDVETTVVIFKPSSGGVFIGVAQLASGDVFSKTIGREIAAGRALKAWQADPGWENGEIWVAESGEDMCIVFGEVPDTVDIPEEVLY